MATVTSEITGLREWASRIGVYPRYNDKLWLLRAIYRKKLNLNPFRLTANQLLQAIQEYEAAGEVVATDQKHYNDLYEKMSGGGNRNLSPAVALRGIASLD